MLPAELRGLLRPEAYPHPVEDVRVIQTHISYVLLAGDWAYKIKKPVDFGFVDYSSLARRKAMCEEEVRLNQRMCEGVYKGVTPITRVNGEAWVGGEGAPIEYAVRMTRVPERQMLPALLEREACNDAHIRAIARKLAQFHASAQAVRGEYGSAAALAGVRDENFRQIAPYAGVTIPAADLEGVRAHVAAALRAHSRLLESRIARGRVRDGHGDLRADSIVLRDDGSVCFMDCIEFSERLRYGDVAYEVAFLAMDLDFRGERRFADCLVSAYLDHAHDETFTVPLNFYRLTRAYIRGKVESLLLGEAEVEERDKAEARGRAMRYFALGRGYMAAAPPGLVITAGLSGTGKSWLAAALAGRIGAALVRSDFVRRELLPGATGHGYGEGMYTHAMRERVYQAMFERAQAYLRDGYGVILDGTFARQAQRAEARQVAADAGVRFLAVETTAPEMLVRERMARREDEPGASDARWDTYLAQRAEFEPLNELGGHERLVLDSSRPLDAMVAEAVARLQAAPRSP